MLTGKTSIFIPRLQPTGSHKTESETRNDMNAKNTPHTHEQKLARELRSHGWTECETSRYASKRTDDSGIDFVGTGCYAIQAKATERKAAYSELLARMVKAEPDKMPLVFHKRNNTLDTTTMYKDAAYK